MPRYQSIYWLCLMLFFSISSSAQNIIEAEYFIDIDPGVGNATPLGIPQAADTIAFDANIATSGLKPGEHILVIRLKTDDGLWSLGNYTRFFVEENYEPLSAKPIKAIDFFVDTDPGIGLGNIENTPLDSTFASIDAALPVASLDAGSHQLIVRSQSADGTWSLGNYSSFYLEENYIPKERARSKIKKVEYFIDGPDPGFHLADSLLPIVPDYLVTVADTLLMSLDTADLGRHAILARVLTEDEEWSLNGLGEYDYCSPEGVLGGFGTDIENNTFIFSDSSKYAVEYIWDMNNGDSLFEAEPIYTYPEGGTYNVCQTVYSFCDTTITCKTFFLPTPRVKNHIADLYISEDSGPIMVEQNLNNVFEDLDGHPLSFSVASNKTEVKANVTGNELIVESTDDYSGMARVVVAAEGGGILAYDTINVEVFPVNDLPIAKNGFNDVLWDEDSGPRIITRFLSREITDVEDRRLEFNVYADTSGLMPVMQRDSLVIYLAEHFNGSGNVYIEATDDSTATSTFSFHVSLLPLPDAPKIIKTFEDFTVFEDSEPVSITNALSYHFSDPDGDPISIEVQSLQEFVSTEVLNDSLFAYIVPDTEGVASIIVSAFDGALTTSDTFKITILPENDAPQFKVSNDLQVCAEQNLEIDLRALVTDSDGFFDDIRFNITLEEISQPNLFPSDLNFNIDQNGVLNFNSNSKEAAKVALTLEATDLQNASNDTTLIIDLLGASIFQKGDTLMANSGSGFQWYKGGSPISGATQDKFVPTKKDFYQVAVNHGNCQILSEPFQVTGLEINDLLQQININPNPTTESTILNLRGEYRGEITYTISDTQGRILYSDSFNKNSFEIAKNINVRDLAAGFYIITLYANGVSISKKLYKN